MPLCVNSSVQSIRNTTAKKYTVAVFQSGTEDLYEQTHQLLLYNRNRAAELEAKQQVPVME